MDLNPGFLAVENMLSIESLFYMYNLAVGYDEQVLIKALHSFGVGRKAGVDQELSKGGMVLYWLAMPQF